MRTHPIGLAWVVLLATLAGVAGAEAQATGMPSFNAPYRAFVRSEFGVTVNFPDRGGTAIEGAYRYASAKFDFGVRGGMYDPSGAGKTSLLAGVEARERVITHSLDFPLDGALFVGLGGSLVSGGSELFIPVGLSLGRRVDKKNSSLSVVPYLQPTATFVADGESDVLFTMGFGADFRFGKSFDIRFGGGVGDLDGVSLGAVWVH
jgi:hypothetical protein